MVCPNSEFMNIKSIAKKANCQISDSEITRSLIARVSLAKLNIVSPMNLLYTMTKR